MGSDASPTFILNPHVSPKIYSHGSEDLIHEASAATITRTVSVPVKKISQEVFSERRRSARLQKQDENQGPNNARVRKYEMRTIKSKKAKVHEQASEGLRADLVPEAGFVSNGEELAGNTMDMGENGFIGGERFETNLCHQSGMSADARVKDTLKIFNALFLQAVQVHFAYGQTGRSILDRRGVVCDDISGGQENFPIPATNVVDPPFAPTGFVYHKSLIVAKSVNLPPDAEGCQCIGGCVDFRICACAGLNGSEFPYVRRYGERLVQAKDVVFECGPNCRCGSSCVNRTSQRGLRYRLEVFRTPNKGWAVRSLESIPSGAPICEYTGFLRQTDEIDNELENNYIFEIDCLQTMKGIDGRQRRFGDVSIHSPANLHKIEDKKSEGHPEFCIDAGSTGNVARFINHSCEPNLFVQCVLSSHHDLKLARVMLFASDNIPPLQELTYDYGYALGSVMDADGKIKTMPCYCGASSCRKRLY
ncbi:hypothetical protein AMTR_s00002p00271340 [Amborella trichopoda]|uniref:SET domain-containing protein n=1 Tax=Amborella trichopoda TaxID=13333 RepID=W1NV81_AMBTC|nr:hypothetical protein AMTR_s00002p00271340 [Amborella trichopoda]